MQKNMVPERPETAVQEMHLEPEETKVVIHTLHENGVKRKQSVDSVDLMIEEEIKNITEDLTKDPGGNATTEDIETSELQDIESEEA